MHKEYWLNRWETGNTRFNEPNPHQYLIKYLDKLVTNHGNNIFVPLCGKSIDMTWLLENNQKVTGVEISQIPIQDFFRVNDIKYTISTVDKFSIYQAESCTIYNGDIFDLKPKDLININAVYDRGAFIALPAETLRIQYIDWLKSTLPKSCKILLITFEFDQNEMEGPPFTVNQRDLEQYFGNSFSVTLLERQIVKNIKPHWKERGLRTLYECAYLLDKI